jgi:hypothetical protein
VKRKVAGTVTLTFFSWTNFGITCNLFVSRKVFVTVPATFLFEYKVDLGSFYLWCEKKGSRYRHEYLFWSWTSKGMIFWCFFVLFVSRKVKVTVPATFLFWIQVQPWYFYLWCEKKGSRYRHFNLFFLDKLLKQFETFSWVERLKYRSCHLSFLNTR